MNPEFDLGRARALFDAALEQEAQARAGYLQEHCADADLRAYVWRLLQAEARQTIESQRVAASIENALQEAQMTEVRVGDRLGPWRLVGELGAGGMGMVFLAEREDGHFQQRAAVKVLHGIASEAAITRLADERQMLASLNHPNIARLLDGGATPNGRPFLVMDHVEGQTLDAYLRQHPLSLPQRLRLFEQICAPVSYAHARLIVHCDLKPSNILITPEGRPVLLDFGIARLLDTGVASAAGPPSGSPHTPGYASPELRRGGPITTAADVFALGIILRDLVGAAPPQDVQAIIGRASAEQDLRRYASVTDLILDLHHFQQHRPVQARAGGRVYRLQRLLRRHWLAAVVIVGVLALSSGFSFQLWRERDRARSAEATALREAETARATTGFLQDVFRGADLDEGGGRDTTALSLVDRGRDRIRTELADQPLVQVPLLGTLADVYNSLGEPKEAETLLVDALTKARALPAPPDQMANLLIRYSQLLAERNRHAEAEPFAREAAGLALNGAAAALADARPDSTRAAAMAATLAPTRLQIDALSALANVETGLQRSPAAQALLSAVLHQREQLRDPPEALALTWFAIAEDQMAAGQLAAAQSGFQRVFEVLRTALGSNHPRTLSAQLQLAVAMSRQEQLTEAEALMRDVLARRLALHGERSSQVANIQTELAYLLNLQGRYRASADFHEQVLRHDAAVQGEQSPVYARTLNNLAFAYMNMGDAERGIAAFRRSLAIREATLPAGDLAIARAQNNLARFLISLNRLDEAAPLVEAARLSRSRQLPENNEERIESLLSAQELARRRGDLAKAQSYWQQVSPHLAGIHPYTQLEAARAHAWLAVSNGEPNASGLISAYIDGLRSTLGPTNPAILRGQVAEAEMRMALGEQAAAKVLARTLQQQFRALSDAYPPDSMFHGRLQAVLDAAPTSSPH